MFHEWIGVEVWVYLDNIYAFTDTIEQHKNVLEYVLKCLKDEQLYISPKKLRSYTIHFTCLGHYQDENGLHTSADKLDLIRKWLTPSSYHNMQRFLGLIEYILQFLPSVSVYTMLLSRMCSNGLPFIWRTLHDKCFRMIKQLL